METIFWWLHERMCESCDQAHWGSSIHTRSKTSAEQSLNMLNISYMYFSIAITIGVCHSYHVIRILQVKSSCTNITYKIDIELKTTLLSTVSPCRRVRRRVCPLCLQRGGRAPHYNTLYHGLGCTFLCTSTKNSSNASLTLSPDLALTSKKCLML